MPMHTCASTGEQMADFDPNIQYQKPAFSNDADDAHVPVEQPWSRYKAPMSASTHWQAARRARAPCLWPRRARAVNIRCSYLAPHLGARGGVNKRGAIRGELALVFVREFFV